MPEHELQAGVAASPELFEALYQGSGVSFGEHEPRMEAVPWEMDGPQPLLAELEAAGEITGPVLECGCGLGGNALFLADRGYGVTAFDASSTAIERARAKVRAAGSPVEFTVADATSLEGIRGGFATVVDSAMLHCLTDEQRRAYLAGLRRVCQPAARLHVFCFQTRPADTLGMPAKMDEESLRQTFDECGWNIQRMHTRRYTTTMSRQQAHEQMPAELREYLIPDLDSQHVAEQKGVSLPVWQISAQLASPIGTREEDVSYG